MERALSTLLSLPKNLWRLYRTFTQRLAPAQSITFHVFLVHGLAVLWILTGQSGTLSVKPPAPTVAVTTIQLAPPPPPKPNPPRPKPIVQKAPPKPQKKPEKKKAPPSPKPVAKKEVKKEPPPKPKPRPVSKVKEASPSENNKPMAKAKPTVSKKTISKEAPARKVVPSPSPALVKEYQDTLSLFLQSALRLPDFGAVRVAVRVARNGKVLGIEVLDEVSEKNREYIVKRLPELHFPPITEAYPEKSEERFVLTLSNDF